jgi:transposase
VWQRQYDVSTTSLRWRPQDELPPHAELICSPYEPEARYATKRDLHWVGYKVHLTETCDLEQPRLITHVATTPSTTSDHAVTAQIHAALAAQDRLPAEHLVDTGYVDAELLVSSAQDYDVELCGPVPPDTSWQARAQHGYALPQFDIDWEAQSVTCPQGVQSTCWSTAQHPDYNVPVIHVRFPRATCHSCPVREDCTRARNDGRTLTFLERESYEALQARRQAQQTPAFRQQYQARAGIEGTLSQGVRALGLRRARYRGLAKTHLQHVLTAVAMNLIRLADWWREHEPRGTRIQRFLTLAPPRLVLLPISC